MGRHARDIDLPTTKMDEKQDVVCYQPAQRPDLGGEEVGRHEDVQMRADKLLPGGGRLPLRCWGKVMALQDVADALVTDRIAQVCQSPHDAVIAPGAILPGYAHNQRLQFRDNFWTAWGPPLGGAVKLLGDQLRCQPRMVSGLTMVA